MSFVDIIAPIDNQEGTKMIIQSWMKEIGSPIIAYEPLVELETDKVTMEVEAPADGVLVEICIEIGTEIQPGAVLGRLSTEACEATNSIAEKPLESSSVEPISEVHDDRADTSKTLSPSVRKFVNDNNLDVTQIIGNGRKGRITLVDTNNYLDSRNAVTHEADT